jgi:hypothetical protein
MKLPDNFIFSQSSLQDYVNCPYQFYLRHIMNLAWPAPQTDDTLRLEVQMLSGARFHRLIQQYFLGIPTDRLDAAAMADPNPQMLEWWQNFLTFIRRQSMGKISPELTLITKLKQRRLMAKFDLVILHGSTATIFDWKTNARPLILKSMLKRMQTRVYLYLLAQEYGILDPSLKLKLEDTRMIYWQANFPENSLEITYSDAACQADHLYLTHLIDEILAASDESFHKTDDLNQCKYCNYRSLCDRGVQAGSFNSMEMDGDEFNLDTFNLDLDQINEIAF